jgi:hypothetical protein
MGQPHVHLREPGGGGSSLGHRGRGRFTILPGLSC